MTDWMSKLQKIDNAVNIETDPYATVINMPSPSLGYVFDKGHGLPLGFTVTLWGPPGGGKSLLASAIAGQLHKDDPEAIVVKFNTELRESIQLPKSQHALFGIDSNRYIAFNVNTPDGVFDNIEQNINAMCQQGAPIKLIIIDSLNSIQGRRSFEDTTIMTQQRGDEALTLGTGFKRILPVIRNNKIGLIVTNHVRAEMDPYKAKVEGSLRMATAYAVQHYIEYYLYVEKDKTKGGRQDILGENLVDPVKKDLDGKEEKTGFKIWFKMTKNSVGVDGRSGQITFDYDKGLVNKYEELFLLGVNLGIVERPNNMTYVFDGSKWTGKESFLTAIKDSQELSQKLEEGIKNIDKVK